MPHHLDDFAVLSDNIVRACIYAFAFAHLLGSLEPRNCPFDLFPPVGNVNDNCVDFSWRGPGKEIAGCCRSKPVCLRIFRGHFQGLRHALTLGDFGPIWNGAVDPILTDVGLGTAIVCLLPGPKFLVVAVVIYKFFLCCYGAGSTRSRRRTGFRTSRGPWIRRSRRGL